MFLSLAFILSNVGLVLICSTRIIHRFKSGVIGSCHCWFMLLICAVYTINLLLIILYLSPLNIQGSYQSNVSRMNSISIPPSQIPVTGNYNNVSNSSFESADDMASSLKKEQSENQRLASALKARMEDNAKLECDLRTSLLQKIELKKRIAELSKQLEQVPSNALPRESSTLQNSSENSRVTAHVDIEKESAEKQALLNRISELQIASDKTAITEQFTKEKEDLLNHILLLERDSEKARLLISELQAKNSELDTLKISNAALSTKNEAEKAETHDKIATLDAELTKARQTIAEMREKTAELESSCNINRALSEQYAKEKRELLDQLSSAQQEASRNNIAFSEYKTRAATLEEILGRKDKEAEEMHLSSLATIQKMEATVKMLTNNLNQQSSIAAADMDRLSKCLQVEVQAKESALRQLSKIPPDPFSSWTRNKTSDMGIPKDPPNMPRGADPDHWTMFCKADPFNSKRLDAGQLGIALSAGPWPPLSIRAIVLLIRTYDRNGDFVDFEFFTRVWPQMHQWKKTFFRHHNGQGEFVFGYIPFKNMAMALKEIDITIPLKVLELIFKRIKLTGDLVGWDDFVCLAARLQAQINDFQRVDTDEDRVITVLYDQYMDMINRCVF
ncbi:hypothetical protein RTP6_005147 [Batrachochytrium dendrobatidis]